MKGPCFWLRERKNILPAFTDLSANSPIQLATDEHVVLVTPEGPVLFP